MSFASIGANNARICSEHFRPEEFRMVGGKKKLVRGAFPTIFAGSVAVSQSCYEREDNPSLEHVNEPYRVPVQLNKTLSPCQAGGQEATSSTDFPVENNPDQFEHGPSIPHADEEEVFSRGNSGLVPAQTEPVVGSSSALVGWKHILSSRQAGSNGTLVSTEPRFKDSSHHSEEGHARSVVRRKQVLPPRRRDVLGPGAFAKRTPFDDITNRTNRQPHPKTISQTGNQAKNRFEIQPDDEAPGKRKR